MTDIDLELCAAGRYLHPIGDNPLKGADFETPCDQPVYRTLEVSDVMPTLGFCRPHYLLVLGSIVSIASKVAKGDNE